MEVCQGRTVGAQFRKVWIHGLILYIQMGHGQMYYAEVITEVGQESSHDVNRS
jgi:hypothetical protein